MESNLVNFKDAFYLIKSLIRIHIAEPTIYEAVVNYLVERGYDQDDYKGLGIKRGVAMIYNISMGNP